MAIDELLERLLPVLQMVSNNPGLIAETAGEMCCHHQGARRNLRRAFTDGRRGNLPAIDQLLTPQDRAEILSEMRGRRRSG